MSDLAKDVVFSLKVVINKQKTKVLFAEIDSDLADVLFSFLTLPLGTIVRILKKQYGDKAPVFGSITTLYDGLSNLESCHFRTEGSKQMLLNPTSAFINECSRLKLDIGDNQPTTYFTCENLNCIYPGSSGLAMYYDFVRCKNCGKQLKKEIPVRNVSKAVDGGVFTIRTATFIISDDLHILPNATASFRRIVSDLGLVDVHGTELRNVTFGFNEKDLQGFFYHKTSSPNEEYFEVNSQGSITFGSLVDKELYTKGPRKYMVKDDLTVTPLCMTLYLNTLNEQKISLSDVDELELNIGFDECLSILKASLTSTSVLSTGLNHLIKKQPKQEQ